MADIENAGTPQELETQNQVDESTTAQESNQQGTPDGGDEWFLSVNDTTKYRTREDAVKAYDEAGKRIQQLSRWEKEIANRYGVKDPAEVQAALDDYLKLREQEQQRVLAQQKQATASQTQPGVPKTHSDEDLTPEEQQALKWMQKMAPRLGYVPKEDLENTKKSIEEQLAELRGFKQQAESAQQDQRINEGKHYLSTLMTEAKLPQDEKLQGWIERGVKAWLEEGELKGGYNPRLEKFWQGGEATREVLKEAFEDVAGALNLLRNQQTAQYAQKKTNVIAKNKPQLPQAGLPGEQPKKTAAGKVDWAELREKAVAMLGSNRASAEQG